MLILFSLGPLLTGRLSSLACRYKPACSIRQLLHPVTEVQVSPVHSGLSMEAFLVCATQNRRNRWTPAPPSSVANPAKDPHCDVIRECSLVVFGHAAGGQP